MRDLFFSLTYNLITRLVLLLISIFSVNILTVTEYGELSYILTLIAALAIVSLFGGGVSVNRGFTIGYLNKDFETPTKILISNLIISTFFSLMLLTSLIFISDSLSENIFIFLIFLVMSINGIFEGVLYGTRKYQDLAVNSFFVFILSVIASYFLIKNYKVSGALISLFIYRLLILILNLRTVYKSKLLRRINLRYLYKDLEVIKSLKEISFPAFISALLVAPVTLIIMYFLKQIPNGIDELAYFSWVNQIYMLAVFFPSVLTGFFISKMSGGKIDAFNKLISYSKYNIFFSVSICLALYIAKPLILGWAGSVYIYNSNVTYNIMLIVVFLYCLNSAFGSYWLSINKAYVGLVINLLWSALTITFSYILLPIISNSSVLFMSLGLSYLIILLFQFLYVNKKEVWRLSGV